MAGTTYRQGTGWLLFAGVMLVLAGVTGALDVLLAGFGVVSGAEWARAVGIFVAALWIVVRIPWVFAFPIASLIGIFLAVLVIYGLAVYGGAGGRRGSPSA